MKPAYILLGAMMASGSTYAYEQDLYIAGSLSSHELGNESGEKYAFHVGAKNIYSGDYYVGGELEFALLENSDFEEYYRVKEDYSYSLSVPFGKRFTVDQNTSFDAYGLVGYTALRIYNDTHDATYDGFRWGAGIDGNLSNVIVGLRFTQAKLTGDSTWSSTEKNLGLMLGYRFQL
ncbi:outer membrane beta-barrel protein [Enterovibrio calviensis]|uniref:outer membrane beta-barrel protein n=1 Tax=Enterovibrio calviensis TaxID=91359 RepID=UPI00048A3D6A|nr:outer membrane beta-barrel protein [Enterovibrio calviensis]